MSIWAMAGFAWMRGRESMIAPGWIFSWMQMGHLAPATADDDTIWQGAVVSVLALMSRVGDPAHAERGA